MVWHDSSGGFGEELGGGGHLTGCCVGMVILFQQVLLHCKDLVSE